MGDVNFYWSARYKSYLAIVGSDVTEADDNGYFVTLYDVKSILYAAVGLEYKG